MSRRPARGPGTSVRDVETIQLALFLNSPPLTNALKLWDKLNQGAPNGFQTLAPGHTQVQGALAASSVTVVVQPNRVDLLFSGIQAQQISNLPPVLDNPRVALDEALRISQALLPDLQVGRTAAVMQGHTTATSHRNALDTFAAIVPGLPTPPSAQEIVYQVAMAVPSAALPGRPIKRVSRWQNVTSQMVEVSFGLVQTPQFLTQNFTVHCYVDVFCERMEPLNSAEAYASMKEVANIALTTMTGGFSALR